MFVFLATNKDLKNTVIQFDQTTEDICVSLSLLLNKVFHGFLKLFLTLFKQNECGAK